MSEKLDNELAELSLLVLKTSYWREFSMLTNKYIDMGKSLTTDIEDFVECLSDRTNVYGRDKTLYTERLFSTHIKFFDDSVRLVNGLSDALKLQGKAIYFNGEKVFVWKDGIWVYFKG